MRVLHVAAGNLYGGVDRIRVDIARAGTAAHEFAICFEGRLLDELRATGASTHVLGAVRFSRPATLWRARRNLRSVVATGAFDSVVCHSPWAYALASPELTPEVRRVVWAHDVLDGTHWTERRIAQTPPDLMVCNSHATAGALRRWIGSVPLEVVHAPVAPNPHPAAERDRVREELGVSRDTIVILIASRFERWKGHGVLLDAATHLEGPWTIWIAGGPQRGPEEALAKQLRAMCAARGLNERVRFLGERRDVPRLLRGADVLCQPNTAPEPFGIVFAEALYAGVPVVTSDAGGAREIVHRTCGVMVPIGDERSLATALQALIDDPALRARLGSAGPARAASICSPASQVARLEALVTASARARAAS
jgi:glycosyltransferase involved in cell wall biosynthesis